MVRRQKINTITNQGIKNWNRDALIPDSVFNPYLPKQGGIIKSSDFNVLFKLLQTGVNALNLHIFRSFIFNLTTTNVAVTNPTDESLSGGATFQDIINKENKIRIVQNTTDITTNKQNITQNASDITDLQNANEANVLGSVLYYNGTDTIGTEVKNQNIATAENLGFYLTFYKNRNETDGTNYLDGDIRYFIQLGSVNGAVSYCQNRLSGSWIATDCPYNDSRTIVIKKTLDNALSKKVDNIFINESLNQQGEFNYTENASPIVKKTDLGTNDYTELRILTDGAHLRKNDTTYIAQTADEIVVKDLLDTSIAPINQDINTLETVNNNQNMRLSLIEQTIAQAASDFGYLKQTTTTQVTTTNKYIISPFVTGFEFASGHISYDNTTDPTVGKFTLTKNAKVIFNFVGNVTREATDTLDFIYEIWDLESETVLTSDTTTFDFTVQSTIFNQGGILSYNFDNIDGTNVTERNFAVRFRVSTGTLSASQFKIPIDVIFTTSSGTEEILTFEYIQNDTNVVGVNGRDVINNLNTAVQQNKSNITSLESTKADINYVDNQFETKLTKQQTAGVNESKFGYTTGDNSPYIEKYDSNTDRTVRLITFANQNPVIQTLEGASETSGTYEPVSANELIIKNDLDKTETRINNKIEPLQIQVDTNTANIAGNVASINTLNSVVSENFETYGRYNIKETTLDDTDGEVRFNLLQQIPLDPTYIAVGWNPNQFVNLMDGKITFNIIADGIVNNETVDLTLRLKIYANNTLIDSESKVIEAGKTVSVNFAGTFDVKQDDSVYATLQIISGTGTLITINPIIINIDFNSNGTSAIKSSQIINDKTDETNKGINADLNQTSTNRDDIITLKQRVSDTETNISTQGTKVTTNEQNISANEQDINELIAKIDRMNEEVILFQGEVLASEITLSESYYNFKEVIIGMNSGTVAGTTMISIITVPTIMIQATPSSGILYSSFSGTFPAGVQGSSASYGMAVWFTGDNTLRPYTLPNNELYFVIGKHRLEDSEIALRKANNE